MARNKNKYLKDLELVEVSKSIYIKEKMKYINKDYGKLHLKDIVCDVTGHVYGVCDCECGEKDVVTNISKLVHGSTKSCLCVRTVGRTHNTKYDNHAYIGKVYGHMRVIKAFNSMGDGIYWYMQCIHCGRVKVGKACQIVASNHIGCKCYRKVTEEYIGRVIRTDKIVGLNGVNSEGRSLVIVQCTKCGKEREVLYKSLNAGNAKKCDCQLKVVCNDYDSYIGKNYCGHSIMEVIRIDWKIYFRLKCETCGKEYS